MFSKLSGFFWSHFFPFSIYGRAGHKVQGVINPPLVLRLDNSKFFSNFLMSITARYILWALLQFFLLILAICSRCSCTGYGIVLSLSFFKVFYMILYFFSKFLYRCGHYGSHFFKHAADSGEVIFLLQQHPVIF